MPFLDDIAKAAKAVEDRRDAPRVRAPSARMNVYEEKVVPMWTEKDVNPGFDGPLFKGLLKYKWGGWAFKESKSSLRTLLAGLRTDDPFSDRTLWQIEHLPEAKQKKYAAALGYLKGCTAARVWAPTGPAPYYALHETDDGREIQITRARQTYMRLFKILGHDDDGWPNFSPSAHSDTKDQDYIKNIGIAAVRAVRALMCLGPFNNRMWLGDDPGRIGTRNDALWICNMSKDEAGLRSGHNRSRNMANWTENLAVNFAGMIPDAHPMKQQLYRAAGYSYGARLMGGGVCAHLSLVTLGVLSTIAQGIEACSVYSQKDYGGFDHNFVLARRGDSGWWVIDPWPMETYVLPWEDCSFRISRRRDPKSGLGNCTRVAIDRPAVVPFGVGFTDTEVDTASEGFLFNIVRRFHTEKGWTWEHPSNLGRGNHKKVVGPGHWGKGIL